MSDERELLAAVLESTSALVMLLGRDGDVLEFNRACELASGLRFDEVRGRRLGAFGLIPESERLLRPEGFADREPRSFPREHEGVWLSKGRGRRIITWTDKAVLAPDGSIKSVVRTGIDVTEQRRAERRLATQFDTLRVLAEVKDEAGAIAGCLEAITRGLGFELGEYWALEESTKLLKLARTWRGPLPALRAFERISQRYAFTKGQGLPGRIWAEGPSSWWVEDLTHDPQFLPTAPAIASGLRSGFGFPIADGGNFLGVMTFFTTETVSSDAALTATMASLGSQIGEFLRRRRAEDQLRDSEERLRTVMNEAPVLLFTLDPKGVVTLAEGRALGTLGMTSNGVVGRSIHDLYAEHPKVLSDLARALKGEAFIECAEMNGAFLEGHYSPLRGPAGEDRGVIGVTVDITERRRTEGRVRMFAALVENSGDFIAMADADGKVNYINPAGRALVGLEGRGPLPARTIAEFLDDSTRAVIENEALPAVARDGHWVGSGQLLGSLGSARVDVQINLFLVREAENAPPLCLAAILRDVTERTRVEQELTRARDAAEAGSRAKSEFLANMSHEIRTPLTAILGSSDMLQDRSLPESLRTMALQTISRNGEHLLQIINNLLDLSKLEAERAEPEITTASPAAIMAEVLSSLNVQARGKGIELVASAEGPIPRQFETDPTRLRQILFNLIGNAIKFTSTGTVSVKLGIESPSVRSVGNLVIGVRDQGIGMTAEQVAHLFTPFYQADSSHTRVFGGTGLGLYISQRLAESLGGHISVESEVGVGSCFTLRLPVKVDSVEELFNTDDDLFAVIGTRSAMDDSLIGPLRGRLLLVEDSRDNQRVVSYYLERLGLEIEIAENGRAAVDMATSCHYDLILMDMQMPELDGYAATRLLRKRGYSRPIVALTAHALTGDAEKCYAAGCDDYLRKPVEWERLSATLRRHLEPGGDATRDEANDMFSSNSAEWSSHDDSPLVSEFAGDPGFMELVRDYVDDLKLRIPELQGHAEGGRLDSLGAAAHNLKGSGGMYGYSELSEIAGLLEDAIREQRERDLIGALAEEVVGVIRRIERGLALSTGVSPGESHTV
ncbi:ATP-binding protein [Singulisphaera sp. PoT]|uniref:ATP-binding protein n=1 Tax=Singulisphaera sp. PoT TaxID=3411797 RepID=UPI003BF59DDA